MKQEMMCPHCGTIIKYNDGKTGDEKDYDYNIIGMITWSLLFIWIAFAFHYYINIPRWMEIPLIISYFFVWLFSMMKLFAKEIQIDKTRRKIDPRKEKIT